MSFGKSGGSQVVMPQLTEEQKQQIRAQTEFFTGTIAPSYTEAVRGATDLYNINAPGALEAAQNQARVARQAQEALGGTGESALRTGITGLQSLFNPQYEANQIMAALAPAQAQYQQNVAQQNAALGATGNLGSARAALASRALAGQTAASQMQTAAAIQQGIQAQRAQAANQLAALGQGGIGQALGAAGNAVTAAMTPQQLYNQYASVIFGTPAASYTPDFRGTQGTVTNTSGYNAGLNFGTGAGASFLGGLGGAIMGPALSDRRAKENIRYLRTVEGVPVYSFNYRGERTSRTGTMAQDIVKDRRYAHAVSVGADGLYRVDYSKLPALDKE